MKDAVVHPKNQQLCNLIQLIQEDCTNISRNLTSILPMLLTACKLEIPMSLLALT